MEKTSIPKGGSFLPIVQELFEKKQKAGVLYEDNGLSRANGMIVEIFDREEKKWMKLDDGTEIKIDSLYAVNGIYSDDFSTC